MADLKYHPTWFHRQSNKKKSSRIEALNGELIEALGDCHSALEGFGRAVAPFISGAISSRNPTVCDASAIASHALTRARTILAKTQKQGDRPK